MTRSMTAFARAEHGAATWEIRSVNHRYLDFNFRLQENMRALEPELRSISLPGIHRGKVECTLKLKREEIPISLTVNEPLVIQLNNAANEIKSITNFANDGDILSLMRWPDVLNSIDNTEGITKDVIAAYKLAVIQLIDMREREGKKLSEIIEAKLKEVEATITEVRLSVDVISKHLRTKLKARLEDLAIDLDPGRLEQEFVIQAQKLDIAEELDRLDTHIAEVRRSLESSEPVGRRLDFLMQELNREANTLSSKSQSSDTTISAVDLKVLIEQIREQVQNIE